MCPTIREQMPIIHICDMKTTVAYVVLRFNPGGGHWCGTLIWVIKLHTVRDTDNSYNTSSAANTHLRSNANNYAFICGRFSYCTELRTIYVLLCSYPRGMPVKNVSYSGQIYVIGG